MSAFRGKKMTKSRGLRRKTRKILTKNPREKGRQALGALLHEYEPEEKVVIRINSSVHKGMPHRRYHGKIGLIKGKRGRSYIVKVTEGSKERTLILRPEHVKPYKD